MLHVVDYERTGRNLDTIFFFKLQNTNLSQFFFRSVLCDLIFKKENKFPPKPSKFFILMKTISIDTVLGNKYYKIKMVYEGTLVL